MSGRPGTIDLSATLSNALGQREEEFRREERGMNEPRRFDGDGDNRGGYRGGYGERRDGGWGSRYHDRHDGGYDRRGDDRRGDRFDRRDGGRRDDGYEGRGRDECMCVLSL